MDRSIDVEATFNIGSLKGMSSPSLRKKANQLVVIQRRISMNTTMLNGPEAEYFFY